MYEFLHFLHFYCLVGVKTKRGNRRRPPDYGQESEIEPKEQEVALHSCVQDPGQIAGKAY